MDSSESKRTRLLICLGLALATIGVYCRVGGFGFVNYDDPKYILENQMVRAGLTLKGVIWAFTHCYADNWHPLTWLSLMLDCQIFGLDPGAFHWVNVALHTANAVLLFLLLQRLTGAQWRSAIVAALFALHPLHVESVAWVAERKDVLSTFFALLTLLAYARYVAESKVQPVAAKRSEGGGPKTKVWFVTTLALFVLGLLAKPMLVTLPFVMLLLDFWPLQRFRAAHSDASVTQQTTLTRTALILEKTPFFILSIVSCAITVYAQKTGGAMATLGNLPFHWRVFIAIESYSWYVAKTFWPVHLAMLYPLHINRPILPFIGASFFLLLVSGLAIKTAERRPYLAVGWFWFLGTLVPVIGLVQVGLQATADRYSYLPSIGLFIVIVWCAYELIGRSKLKSMLAAGVTAVVLMLLSAATFVQSSYWKSSYALFSHAVEVTDDNDIALNGLGVVFYEEGRYDLALSAYKLALNIKPSATIYKNIGLSLDKMGKREEAAVQFHHAAAMDPKAPEMQYLWATTLTTLARKEESLTHYEEAVRLDPNDAIFQNGLGVALAAAGRSTEAMRHYAEAVRLEPANAEYQNNLGTALARSGKEDAAIEHYEAAIHDDPKSADAFSNLGALHVSQHRLEDAARDYTEAVLLKPTNGVIYLNAGIVFLKLGHIDDAVEQLGEAVRIDPHSSDAHYEYGHALFLQGLAQRAREELSQAVQIKPGNALAQFYLGLACLQLNSVEEGTSHLEEAARLRPTWADPLNAEAWVLATSDDDKVRNGAKALELAQRAVELTSRQQPVALNTLAAAYAEIGQFNSAISTANQANELAQQLGQTDLVNTIQQALARYHSGRAYREKNPGEK